MKKLAVVMLAVALISCSKKETTWESNEYCEPLASLAASIVSAKESGVPSSMILKRGDFLDDQPKDDFNKVVNLVYNTNISQAEAYTYTYNSCRNRR